MITETSPSPTRARRNTSRVVAVSAIGLAIGLVIGLTFRPTPGQLPDRVSGDHQLATVGVQVVGADRPALALACVTPDVTRTAVIGADLDDRFEIGSISKGLTGLLFQTMITNHQADPKATLGTILPVDGPLADVTLRQLATHTSGLPETAAGAGPTTRNFWNALTAGNPYDQSVQEMVTEAQHTPLTSPPGTYSNLGFELLGAALTTLAQDSYPHLLSSQVLRPLGMDATVAPQSTDELAARDLTGTTSGGRTAAPWLGPAITPAGGVRSDVTDMAALARGLLTRSAPGVAATTPRTAFGESEIGLAWITTTKDRHQVVWHNGGTGGFASFVGVDRGSGTAVVMLSATSREPAVTTRTGFELLERLHGCRS